MSGYERRSGRELAGFIIILIGFSFLMKTMDIFPTFPFGQLIQRFWLPALLIGIGALILTRRAANEGTFAGGFFILLGVLFLMGGLNPWGFEFRKWIGPAILIWIGISFLTRNPRTRRSRREWSGPPGPPNPPNPFDNPPHPPNPSNPPHSPFAAPQFTDTADFFHATVILGAINRRYLSQHFRGGDVTAIMGGGKIDLRDAMIDDVARLEVFTVMGGIEIQVPPGWIIEHRFTPILGGYEDRTSHVSQGNQRLIIAGTAIMGGITISN